MLPMICSAPVSYIHVMLGRKCQSPSSRENIFLKEKCGPNSKSQTKFVNVLKGLLIVSKEFEDCWDREIVFTCRYLTWNINVNAKVY